MIDWSDILDGDRGDRGRSAMRSVPLKAGEEPYWHAAARILEENGSIVEAVVALKDPVGAVRRLGVIEHGLVFGVLSGADAVMDAVRDLVECADDAYGTAAVKSYLAGWVCADVVGRCIS